MIIAICGFGASGASAVIDFLKGYKDLQLVPFEFQLLHQADGISDLKYHLTESRERVTCNAAIKRFRRLMFKSGVGRNIQKIVGANYKQIVDDYLDAITLAEWKGRSSYDPVDISDRSTIPFVFFMQRAATYLLRKINPAWCVPGYRTRYFSILDEDYFDKVTIDFLNRLFAEAGYDIKDNLVLDMLLSATNPTKGMEFFSEIKAIVVVRDPRDIYIRSRIQVFLNAFMPQSSVEDYCTFFRAIREKAKFDDNTICIKYEDLIYKYKETTERIMAFLGYDRRPENEFMYFNPNVSVKYTNLSRKYPERTKEIQYIEKNLEEYLYPFSEFTPVEVPEQVAKEYKGFYQKK